MGDGGVTMISLQYLRAVAALMVVYFHMHWGIKSICDLGALGVDIFFVISGFIVWHTTTNRSTTPLEFIKRRLARIVPLYWIATITMFVMPAISGTIAAGTRIDFPHLLSSLFFVPWPYPAGPENFYPVYVPGWTINYEMFFYLIFGLLLAIGNRTARLIGLASALVVPVALGVVFSPSGGVRFYTSALLLQFLLGVLVAAWFPTGLKVRSIMAMGIIAIGAIGLVVATVYQGTLSALGRGTAAALIVLGLVSWEGTGKLPRNEFFLKMGDASYAIYLTHLFALGAVGVVWTRLSLHESRVGYWLLPLVSMGAAVATGALTHRYIENPLRNLRLTGLARPLRLQ
jgi:exopolysaccharide production protein ExoZ